MSRGRQPAHRTDDVHQTTHAPSPRAYYYHIASTTRHFARGAQQNTIAPSPPAPISSYTQSNSSPSRRRPGGRRTTFAAGTNGHQFSLRPPLLTPGHESLRPGRRRAGGGGRWTVRPHDGQRQPAAAAYEQAPPGLVPAGPLAAAGHWLSTHGGGSGAQDSQGRVLPFTGSVSVWARAER